MPKTPRLQQFVDTVVSHIIKEAPELMEWEFEREGVKLHMTVMNSDFSKRQAAEKDGSWRSGPSQDSGRSKRPLTYSFDSRVFVGVSVIREKYNSRLSVICRARYVNGHLCYPP